MVHELLKAAAVHFTPAKLHHDMNENHEGVDLIDLKIYIELVPEAVIILLRVIVRIALHLGRARVLYAPVGNVVEALGIAALFVKVGVRSADVIQCLPVSRVGTNELFLLLAVIWFLKVDLLWLCPMQVLQDV